MQNTEIRQRVHLGAWAWVLTGLLLVVQVMVALAWPQPYSIHDNAISDLGVTSCGVFSEGTGVERYICSPAHAVLNAAFVATGLLLAVGALLLHGIWERNAVLTTLFLTLAGLALIPVGLFPWDTHPAQHDVAALAQALFQWIGMGLVLSALGRSRAWRGVRLLTGVAWTVSVVGFALFLVGSITGTTPLLSWGVAERVAFDTFTVWNVAVGVLVLSGAVASRAPGPQGRSVRWP